MNLPVAQITEASNLVDHAAAQNDRWLMLAMLVVLITGGAFVIKWLVAFIEKLVAKHSEAMIAIEAVHAGERQRDKEERKAERDEARALRLADEKAFLAALTEKDKVCAQQTKAIEALTIVITDHDKAMRIAHDEETAEKVQMTVERVLRLRDSK